MSEQLKTYTETEAREYVRIFRAIGQKGLEEIDSIYGTGFDDNRLYQADDHTIEAFVFPWNSNIFHELYLFHNGRHGRYVGEGSAKDMRYLGLPEPYVSLAKALGEIHDRIRTSGIVANERESADWFNNELTQYNIPEEDLVLFQASSNEVNEATIPILRGAQLIGQRATEQVYTHDINQLMAYIVASNDLGELHKPTGPLISHLWCCELHKGEPTHEQLIEFETSQVAMDTEYQHPLALWDTDNGRPTRVTNQFIQRRFTPYRSAVIEHSTRVLDSLRTGRLRNYRDVIHYDIRFAIDCHRGVILPDYQT